MLQSLAMHFNAMTGNDAWDNLCISMAGNRVVLSENYEAQSDTFKSLDFVPMKKHLKYQRYSVGSIVLALTLLVIIPVAYAATVDDKTSDFRGKVFLLIDDTKLMKFDHNTQRLDLALEAPENSTVGAFSVHDDSRIYWTENKASRLVSQSDKEVKVLLEERRFTPEGLALDRISENVYVVDKSAGTLIVMNIRNGYYAILLTDLVNAQDVVLDSEEGRMFILQHSHSILSANMDGSEPVDVVTNNGIAALAIDTNRKRIYWITNRIIESSDYDGKNRQNVSRVTDTNTSVTFLGNYLLWIQVNQQQSISIMSCKIHSDNTCQERASHEINTEGDVKSIQGYSSDSPSFSNPCQINNGDCEDLCLPSRKNKSSCACRMGWELSPDKRSCHEVRDFVLYPYGDVVRTCSLDGKREIFWPTPYEVTLNLKSEIDFDYDMRNDDFYFSDDHHIHKMKLKHYDGQKVVLSTNSTVIEDVAYDWFTGNIYYGQRQAHGSQRNDEHSLVIFNNRLGEKYRKTLDVYDGNYFKTQSYAMALHPAKGYMFMIKDDHDSLTDVFRVGMNGTYFEPIFHFYAYGVQKHRFFAIDFTENRLYQVQRIDKETTSVAYQSCEGSDMFTYKTDFTHGRSIGVHEQSLYLSNSSSIYRFEKERVENGIRIAPRSEDPLKKVVGVRIVSGQVQFTGLDNPCVKDNGGCEQFCFAGSKATCGCKDGQEVRDDGRCN